jgi:glucosylceramidase
MLDETGGPNIGPYFCGGLVTRDSRNGALSYSGQYKVFRHISKFMQKGARVLELEITDNVSCVFRFPKDDHPLQASLIENPDGSRAYVLVNRDTAKRQVQFEADGRLWYAEMLPNTISTIVVS